MIGVDTGNAALNDFHNLKAFDGMIIMCQVNYPPGGTGDKLLLRAESDLYEAGLGSRSSEGG